MITNNSELASVISLNIKLIKLDYIIDRRNIAVASYQSNNIRL